KFSSAIGDTHNYSNIVYYGVGWRPDKKLIEKGNIIFGKEIGDILVKAIRGAANRVMISSPWIGRGYAEMLVEKALEGVVVRVVTSDRDDNEGRFLATIAEHYREEELKKAEEAVEELKHRERAAKSAMRRNIALTAIATVLAVVASIRFAVYAHYLYVLAGSLTSLSIFFYFAGKRRIKIIGEKLAEAEANFKMVKESVMADREKIKRNLSVLIAPKDVAFVHAKLYIVDGRAWIGSPNLTWSGMHENYEVLVEVDVNDAEEVFTELWNMVKQLRL
ncbi:MAG: hypothetical protein JZD41_09265, partial [Thermoproteus sp.]|nr:hypothetical protein [Thermoproteus sp.]